MILRILYLTFFLGFSLLPGYFFSHFIFFKKHTSILEHVCVSFYFSTIYLSILSVTLFFLNVLNRNSLIVTNFAITCILFIISKQKMSKNNHNWKQLLRNKENVKLYIILCIVSIVSVIIHSYPSFKYASPTGFDTYRLHIIRINYILNNGLDKVGNIVSSSILNINEYQWGFHFYLGGLGMLLNVESLAVLKLFIVLINFFFPISIYFVYPLFNNNINGRLLATSLSIFSMSTSQIHGLVYPFPSTLSLYIFLITLRLIHNLFLTRQDTNKINIILIILIPIYFFIYKGLFLIYLLTTTILVFNRYLQNYLKNVKTHYFYISQYFIALALSISFTIIIGFLSLKLYSHLNLYYIKNSLFNFPEIVNLYKITGLTEYCIFIAAIIYIIKYKKSSNENGIILFIIFLALSCGAFSPKRWLLYFIPIVYIFNGIFLSNILNSLPQIRINIKKGYKSYNIKRDNIKSLITILIIGLISLEYSSYLLKPNQEFGPNFTYKDLQLSNIIKSFNNNSVIIADYRVNIILNSLSINKNIIYFKPNYYINHHYVPKKEYLTYLKYGISNYQNNTYNTYYLIISQFEHVTNDNYYNPSTARIILQDTSFLIYEFINP